MDDTGWLHEGEVTEEDGRDRGDIILVAWDWCSGHTHRCPNGRMPGWRAEVGWESRRDRCGVSGSGTSSSLYLTPTLDSIMCDSLSDSPLQ